MKKSVKKSQIVCGYCRWEHRRRRGSASLSMALFGLLAVTEQYVGVLNPLTLSSSLYSVPRISSCFFPPVPMLHSVMSPSSVCLRIRRLLLPVMDKLLERSLEIIDKYEPRFCPKPVRVVTDDMFETMIFEYLTLLNRFFSDSASELLHVKFRSNFLSVMYVGAGRRRRSSFPLSPRSRVLGFSQFSNRRSELISPLRLRREPQTQTKYCRRDAILHDSFKSDSLAPVSYQRKCSYCSLSWFAKLKT